MILLALIMALVAVLYGAAGQAGGSGFVAVMTFAHFGTTDIRGTTFFLNIVAAAYATLQVHRARLADWKLQWLLLAGSVPCAALGGMIPLQGRAYYALTGLILFTVAGLMMLRRARPEGEAIGSSTAIGIGAITGLASGVTGVGGGVFLSSLLILLGKASPKSTMSLSPPFILANSAAALGGLLASGQRLPPATVGLSGAVLAGSVIGSAIGLRWMSGGAIRAVLVLILLAGGAQMLIRAAIH